MAVMARLLAARSLSAIITEDVSQEKLAAQYIHRELREADEANLLDEEDMHVFGLKPMTDPLHLVCCNACKKPVKASQYTAHAELCKSLNPMEESLSELDSGAGHKKPPRKERKKSLIAYANQATVAEEKERFEIMDADDTAASEPHLDEQIGMACSFPTEIKGYSACVDVAHVVDGSGVSHGNTDYTAGVMPPPKRSKLRIAPDCPSLADGPERVYGVNRTMCASSHGAYTSLGYPKGSIVGSDRPCNHLDACQKLGQDQCTPSTKGVPAPLATKMYYSQRNHRLRSAISHLYYAASSEGHCSELVSPKVFQGNMALQASSPKNFSNEQMGNLPEKRETHSLPSMQTPDQVLVQGSEVSLSKSEGCPPAMNLSNQVPVNNVLRPHTASVGNTRSKYLSKPYSFASNSGPTLGTIQQPKGSVSVT